MAVAQYVDVSGKHMWSILVGLVVYHELTCREGQLLSEEVDRAVDKYPVLVYVFTFLTVAHLLNWLPKRLDPYALFGARIYNLKGYEE